MNEDVKNVLIIFSKHGPEVLSGPVKEGPPDQDCKTFLRSIHHTVSRSRFVEGGFRACPQEKWQTGALFVIERSCANRFSVNLQVRQLGQARECLIVFC